MATDVTATKDTTNVVGKSGPLAEGAGLTNYAATVKDTRAGVGALEPGGTGGIDNNKAATQPDTSGASGHTGNLADGYLFSMSGQVDTLSGGGSPIQQANPAYRAPATYDAAATVKDTTKTDLPISDGTTPSPVNQYMSQNLDTVNQKVTLRTTSTNLPSAPSAPTVVAGVRSATVTITQPSDPSGAPLRNFRVEFLQVLVDATSAGAIFPHGSLAAVAGYGVDFAPTSRAGNGSLNSTTTVVVGPEGAGIALTSGESYVFRVAAVNDNGTSAYSAWSSPVTILNDNAAAGPGHYTALADANKAEPVYSPVGTVKPGTNGTCGPVTSLVAATGSGASGTMAVTFNQATWGVPVSYTVEALAANGTVAKTQTSTTVSGPVSVTLTGLTASTSYTVRVTPVNARGNGIPVTSSAATSHA